MFYFLSALTFPLLVCFRSFEHHCWDLSTSLSLLFQRQYIPVNFRRVSFWWFIVQYLFMYLGSLFVLICLSFFLLGSWDYLPSVYGFM